MGSFVVNFNSDDVHENFSDGLSNVCGGLLKCSIYWRNTLSASQFVQSIVDEGYKIPFQPTPNSCSLTNNKSARDHPPFISETICKLLEGRYIEDQTEAPYCVNPMSVAKGKKLRLV